MESSIAEFVERQLACELLPTESRQDQALKLVKCFGHLERDWECACLANHQKKFRGCGFQQVSHAVVCMFQAHQSKAVVACPRHRVAQSSSCKCSDSDSLQTVQLPLADQICEFAPWCIPSRPFGYDQV